MARTPTLFVRDPLTHKLTDQPTPGCEWVLAGEGVATEKVDGLTLRLTVASGRLVNVERRLSGAFVALDPNDGQSAALFVAANNTRVDWWPDGQYACEAIGPTIAGDRYRESQTYTRRLDPTMLPIYTDVPRDFAGLRAFMAGLPSIMRHRVEAEGIVFWHADGRKAKIKVRDF